MSALGFFMYAYFFFRILKKICIHIFWQGEKYVYIFFSPGFLCMCEAAHFFPHHLGNRPGETLADFFRDFFGKPHPEPNFATNTRFPRCGFGAPLPMISFFCRFHLDGKVSEIVLAGGGGEGRAWRPVHVTLIIRQHMQTCCTA